MTTLFIGSVIYGLFSQDHRMDISLNRQYGRVLSQQAQITHLYTQIVPKICSEDWAQAVNVFGKKTNVLDASVENVKINVIGRFYKVNEQIIKKIPQPLMRQVATEKFSTYIEQKFMDTIYALSASTHDKNADKQTNLLFDKMIFCTGVLLYSDEDYKIKNIIKDLMWF